MYHSVDSDEGIVDESQSYGNVEIRILKTHRSLYSFAVIIAIVLGTSLLLSKSTLGMLSKVFSPLEMYKSHVTQFLTYNTSSFQLIRNGYNTLPYFGSTSSSIVSYVFLANYDSLIEPYVNMSVVFSETVGDHSDINFKFTIAKKKKILFSGNFYASEASTHPDTNNFAIACEPYDNLELAIKIYDGKSYKSEVTLN